MLSELPAYYWIIGGALVALSIFLLAYAFKPDKPRHRVRRPLPPPPASRPVGQRYVSGNQRPTSPAAYQPARRPDPERTIPIATAQVRPAEPTVPVNVARPTLWGWVK